MVKPVAGLVTVLQGCLLNLVIRIGSVCIAAAAALLESRLALCLAGYRQPVFQGWSAEAHLPQYQI